MPFITDLAITAQTQFFDTLKVSQDAVLGGLQTLAATVEGASADIPGFDAIPGVDRLPFASELPSPAEVVSGAVSFAQRVITTELEFAGSVLDTVGALATKVTPGAKNTPPAARA